MGSRSLLTLDYKEFSLNMCRCLSSFRQLSLDGKSIDVDTLRFRTIPSTAATSPSPEPRFLIVKRAL